MNTIEKTTPLRSAFRQARFVALGAVSVAVIYNAVATTGVPWIAQATKSAGGQATAADVLGQDSASTNNPAIPPPQPVDTVTNPLPVDTLASSAADAQRVRDSLDAVRAARTEEMKRRQDSILKAKMKVDTAGKNIPKPPPPPAETNAPGKPKDIDDISVVREAFDKKAALFVDARKAEDYAKGHIPGAINVYGEDGFEQYIPMLLKYPKDTRIIVYCGGGLCTLSHETADNISTMRWFSRIFVFTGGTKVWLDAGYPFTSEGK